MLIRDLFAVANLAYCLVLGRLKRFLYRGCDSTRGCRFESRPGLLRTKVYSAFHPYGIGKCVPAAAGKAKAGMAHSDCG